MKHSTVLKSGAVAVSTALLLAACGNGGSEVTGPGGVDLTKYSKWGIVGTVDLSSGKLVTGTFYKLPTALQQPGNPTGFAEDTCTVVKYAPGATPPTPIPGSDQTTTPLDAGAQLTLKKNAANLGVLIKATGPGAPAQVTGYSTNVAQLITADTSGATLEIPGATDGFPAMTVTMPNELAAFTFGPDTGVTKDTAFTWTNATTGAYLYFTASAQVSTNTVLVSCVAKDDGSFAFPAATKTAMDSNGFVSGLVFAASKTNFKVQTQGDAVLFVSNSRSVLLSTQQ